MLRTSRSLLPLILLLVLPMHQACVSYVPVAGGDNFAYLYGKGAAAMHEGGNVAQDGIPALMHRYLVGIESANLGPA